MLYSILTVLCRTVTRHKIDAVLVSHAGLKYIGGLPYVLGVLGLACPVLATVPVHHLGLVTLYDAYQSVLLTSGSAPPETSLDHIDKAFEHITMLRYAQTYYLGGEGGLMISALPAGHTVGGAIWKIKKGDEEAIVYAPAFNHKRESHLDGAPFELITKPTLLITAASQALQVAQARKTRDDSFLEALHSTLKAGGNVLVPIDTASRSLELIQLLEMSWTSGKRTNPLVLLGHQSKRTIELAKGMLEWMGQSMMKSFETDRSNPFELRHFSLVHSIAELNRLPDAAQPKVVLASLESLDCGLGRALLTSWASQAKSLVLLPSPPVPGSLAERLLNDPSKAPKITFRIFERVPLEGEELRAHNRAIEEEKERAAAEAAFAELTRRRLAEEAELDLDELSDAEDGDAVKPVRHGPTELDKINSARALREIYWTDYRHDWYNQDEQFVDPEALDYPMASSLGKRHQMFPFQFYKKRTGDYGILVDPTDFGAAPNVEAPKEATTVEKAPIKEASIAPTKLIDYSKEITVKCRRAMVDFTGLVDGRSLRTILGQIDPKRLILVGGPDDPTDYLLQHALFRESEEDPSVEYATAPALMETVRLSLASNTKQAVVSQAVIDQLDLALFKDIELAHVQARVHYRTDREDEEVDSDAMDIDKERPTDEDMRDGVLVLEAPETGIHSKRRHPLLIGDPKLTELRASILSKLSLQAEFVAGDLVLSDGRVRIRKLDDRSLLIEGASTENYYRIRDLIYSQLAIV